MRTGHLSLQVLFQTDRFRIKEFHNCFPEVLLITVVKEIIPLLFVLNNKTAIIAMNTITIKTLINVRDLILFL
jgi:hypothetical protein